MALINMYLANRRKPLHKPQPLTKQEKRRLVIALIQILIGTLLFIAMGYGFYLTR